MIPNAKRRKMNEIERQIYAATFAAAFEREWAFLLENQGLKEAMGGTEDGFHFAEIADQAVKSYRNAVACEDSRYLLLSSESWPTPDHTTSLGDDSITS